MLQKFSLYQEGLNTCSIFYQQMWILARLFQSNECTKLQNLRRTKKIVHFVGNPSFHLVLKICFGFCFHTVEVFDNGVQKNLGYS